MILIAAALEAIFCQMFVEVNAPFSSQNLLDRTSMNTWEDEVVIAEVNRIGKPRTSLAVLCKFALRCRAFAPRGGTAGLANPWIGRQTQISVGWLVNRHLERRAWTVHFTAVPTSTFANGCDVDFAAASVALWF